MNEPEPQYGTGWIHRPDPRNEDYPMRALLPTETRPVSKLWDFPRHKLNQGRTGTCTGQGMKGHMLCAPIQRTGHLDPPTAFDFYDYAVKIDGIRDNDFDKDPGRTMGTYTNSIMKAALSFGVIAEWRWGKNMDDVLDWCAFKGPVILACSWYDGFFSPDSEGYIMRSGRADSGHLFLCRGYDLSGPRPHLRCVNSWGDTWGIEGEFRIDLALANTLFFSGSGEAVAAMEIGSEPEPPPEPEDPPVPEDVFQYPYQWPILSLQDALLADDFLGHAHGSRGELIYLFVIRVDKHGARLESGGPVYLSGLGLDELKALAADPTALAFVHDLQAKHRSDWNA